MAKPTTDATTAPENTLPEFGVIDAATVPASARGGAALTDDERKYADRIIAALSDGKAVSVGGFADRDAAEKSAARVKRLVNRAAPDTFPGDDKAVRWSVAASGDTFAWFAKIGAPSKAGRKADTETPASE